MTRALLFLLLTAAPDAGVKDAPRAAVPTVLGALKGFSKGERGHAGDTACAACHSTSSWTQVSFNHERTGFPLTGRHARTSCKACHVADFKVPLPSTCGGCHRDVHAGDLGARCEGCHDTGDWRSRFDVDAHRRTNFPLMGAHAALPCQECHFEARERRFSRAAVDCEGCHQNDLVRASASSLNHQDLVQPRCRECHSPLAWSPGGLPKHEACFPIAAGPHNVPCLTCHSSLLGARLDGQCRTGTARCTTCHTNDMAPGSRTGFTDAQHADGKAPGYVFSDGRCLGCHYPRVRLP